MASIWLTRDSRARAQITGLAHINAPVVISSFFSHLRIDADLADLLNRQELSQQAPGHLDHLHDAGGDLGDANAVGLAAGQEDLDRLGCCSCGAGLRHQAPHIDLAGDGGGDQGGAAFLEEEYC